MKSRSLRLPPTRCAAATSRQPTWPARLQRRSWPLPGTGIRPCSKSHVVAHRLELLHEASLVGILLLALDEVVAAELVVGLIAFEQVIGNHQDGMRNGDDRLFVALASFNRANSDSSRRWRTTSARSSVVTRYGTLPILIPAPWRPRHRVRISHLRKVFRERAGITTPMRSLLSGWRRLTSSSVESRAFVNELQAQYRSGSHK